MSKTMIDSINLVIPNFLSDMKSESLTKDWKFLSLLLARSEQKELKKTAMEHAAWLLGLENPGPIAAIKLHQMGYASEDKWVCIADLSNMQPNRDHVSIVYSHFPDLTEPEADIILNDLNNYFIEDGILFYKISLSEWICVLPQQINTPQVSANEIIGKNILDFIPDWRTNMFFKKFLSDTQMVLHHSGGNMLRSHSGKIEINSIWLHGIGRLPEEINSQIDTVITDCTTLRGIAEFAVIDTVASIQEGLSLDSIIGNNILIYQLGDSDTTMIEPKLFEDIFNQLKDKKISQVNLVLDNRFLYTLTPRDTRKFWKRKFKLKDFLD